MTMTTRTRSLLMALLIALLASCASQAEAESAVEAAPVEPLADPSVCFVINPAGSITNPSEPGCDTLGGQLDGFHEGAQLLEDIDYQPEDGAGVAAQIREVAEALSSSSEGSAEEIAVTDARVAQLEVIALEYDRIEIDVNKAAERSRGSSAAYIEVVTREMWEDYFITFFDGPTAQADSAHVVERIFVRMRGFELP